MGSVARGSVEGGDAVAPGVWPRFQGKTMLDEEPDELLGGVGRVVTGGLVLGSVGRAVPPRVEPDPDRITGWLTVGRAGVVLTRSELWLPTLLRARSSTLLRELLEDRLSRAAGADAPGLATGSARGCLGGGLGASALASFLPLSDFA